MKERKPYKSTKGENATKSIVINLPVIKGKNVTEEFFIKDISRDNKDL